MNNYEWDESLSVGNKSIDDDHKGLFSLIAQLESAEMSSTYMADIIGQLELYAKEHFSREEDMMKKVGFPGFDEHIKEHQLFNEWIKTVKTTYRRSAESPFLIADLVIAFLKKWLPEHIMVEDMKYRDFIINSKNKA